MANTPSEPSDMRRFVNTVWGSAVLLGVLVWGAVVLHEDITTTWRDYTVVASVILGVGGVFVLAAISTDGARDNANAVGLAAVGFGGILLAYKEAMASPDNSSTEPNLPALIFLVVAVFAVLALLLALAIFASSTGNATYRLSLLGIVVAGLGLATATTINSPAFSLLCWLFLLFCAVWILVTSCNPRHSPQSES